MDPFFDDPDDDDFDDWNDFDPYPDWKPYKIKTFARSPKKSRITRTRKWLNSI